MAALLSPEVTISYPKLFKAELRKNPKPDDKPMFGAAFLFTQASMDSPQTKALQAEVVRVAVERFGKAGFETLLKEESFDSPFRKDISAKGYPAEFVRYIQSSSGQDHPPAVVGKEIDPKTGKLRVITDVREIYAGAIVIVSLAARAYGGLNTGFKAGVKLDLRNVQLRGDAPRLSAGASAPEEDFGPGEAPATDDDAAALAAMMG